MRLKKLSAVLLSVSLSLTAFSSISSANYQEKEEKNPKDVIVQLTQQERDRLLGLGFQNDQLDTFTVGDYEQVFSDFAGLTGEVVSEDVNYYQLIVDKNGKQKLVKGDKDKYLKAEERANSKLEKKNEKETNKLLSALLPIKVYAASTDTVTETWLKHTLSATKLYDSYGRYTGKIKLQNNWTWLYGSSDAPRWRGVDPVAITKSTNLALVSNTEYSNYSYESTSGTVTVRDYQADVTDNDGLAFKIDLYAGVSVRHKGFMYYQVTKNASTATIGNAYGHYTHISGVNTYGISLGAGIMSVSGATIEDEAADTAIDFGL